MLDHLKTELVELAGKMERQNKIKTMLESLNEEEHELLQKEYELRTILTKEDKDVKRLEKTTATSIFYAMLGRRDLQLEKEHQEAYAAKLKYDATVSQMDDCCRRKEKLIKEQQELAGCEQRYTQVFAEIQKLLHNDPHYADKLCALERQLGVVTSQLIEVSEAVNAGNACTRQILCIQDSLDSAEGWGTCDLFGGGLLSDMAKHSHLDEAQANAEHLQMLLSSFRTELADVKINAEMGQVNIDGFLRFADYFFDGLISDWSVLSRIHDSQKSVSEVKSQVSSALSQLENTRGMYEDEKASLEKQIADLVYHA